jgi:hypothetical protein
MTCEVKNLYGFWGMFLLTFILVFHVFCRKTIVMLQYQKLPLILPFSSTPAQRYRWVKYR